MEPADSKPVAWYLTKKSVFLGLTIFGPLALPLVWLSPRFSFFQKTVLTVTTLALTYLLWKTTVEMTGLLKRRLEETGLVGLS